LRQRIEIAAANQQPQQRIAPPPPAARPAGELPLATPMPRQELKPVPVSERTVKLYPPKIAKALLAITREIDPVQKAGYNTFHKYAYQKWEDILEQLGPLIAKHGLIIMQSETAHGGFERDLIEISYEFIIINEDGDEWPVRPAITAICKVRDSKGVLDDKAASKCHTQAHKYAMVQLFKIRVADMADHDAGENGQKAPARRAPAPNGKMAPHYVQGVEGDTAETWSEKFIKFIEKAASQEELDQWDKMNGKLIDLCQQRDVNVYNKIVDAMTARAATFAPPAEQQEQKTDPISSGPASSKANGGFPGDTPMTQQHHQQPETSDEIPLALDRKLTENDREWLMELNEGFAECTTLDAIASVQDSIMMPAQGSVTPHAWKRAETLADSHVLRVQTAEQR
jgi:hypothetical protein